MRQQVTLLDGLLVAAAAGLYWVAVTLSTRWISRRERNALRAATGREPRKGEEDSLGTWLKVPSPALDDLNQRLKADPFNQLEDIAAGGLPRAMTKDTTPYSIKPPLEDDGKE